MKKKTILIISILVLIMLLIALGIYAIIKKDSKKSDIKPSVPFNEKFAVKDENYYINDGKFIYSSNFENKTKNTQELTCVHIEFKNKNNEVLLTREESIRVTLKKEESYPITFDYETPIDPTDIVKVIYEDC